MMLDLHTQSVVSDDGRAKVPAHSVMGFQP